MILRSSDDIVSFIFFCIALIFIGNAIIHFLKRMRDRKRDLAAALAMSEDLNTIYYIDHVQASSDFDFKSYYIQHKHHVLVFAIPDENAVSILSI